MKLGTGLYEFLSTNLSVGDRCYPRHLPQGVTLPALTWQLVGTDHAKSHSDQKSHPTYTGRRYRTDRVQFTTYGSTEDDAERLSNELEAVLSGYGGLMGEVPVQVGPSPELEQDDYDPEPNSWRRITDYYIGWTGHDDDFLEGS